MRERLAAHRANPVCASCHATMDPIGFGLENFDAVGAWRQAENGTPIDASGTLPNGAAFEGPAELRAALLARPEAFARALTVKLATYALGRGVEPFDAPAIRAILAEAAGSGHTFSSLVLGIAESVPFQMREAAEPASSAAARTPCVTSGSGITRATRSSPSVTTTSSENRSMAW